MGGFGSGRQPWTRRDTVEQRYGLDVRRLSREHLLAPGTQFDWQWCRDDQVVAEVTVRVEAQHVVMAYGWEPPDGPLTGVECRVGLDRTPCPYGGARTWFRCPAPGCGRRITKLFLAGAGVACRHCLHLNYWSQRLRPIDRGPAPDRPARTPPERGEGPIRVAAGQAEMDAVAHLRAPAVGDRHDPTADAAGDAGPGGAREHGPDLRPAGVSLAGSRPPAGRRDSRRFENSQG